MKSGSDGKLSTLLVDGKKMIVVKKATKVGLEISPVFARWQVCCKRCGAIFYIDTEPESTGEEILEIADIHCGLHPGESSVVELV